MFSIRKDTGIIPHVLTQILDQCVNGVTLSDPDLEDNPIVYANKAFEKMTGYSNDEIVGRNCRFLQGDDRNQPGIGQVRDAISSGTPTEVTLRNYRKDGGVFHNHLTVTPLYDLDGSIIYFLGVQYDITDQVEADREIAVLERKLASALSGGQSD